ncbi:hypothetical protein DLAC_09373 [Tieghemostelium lacteum]|uniref:UNC93-like protein MFSD11 n=1 Tax=Tieghemostelium lacteum TaxID=361077 RepID=A0A151Z9W6_TIELA|nr:hypothetical protein DLAC_09373 [Tieghemostelium lacteum]|eukprot:KYQ90736.1 hypothetical protein DLAC_09373 [Tieghemostelium lacteum]
MIDNNDSIINENRPLLTSDVNNQKIKFRDKSIYNVVILGISFCILFSAFAPTQNLETTVNQDLGFLSLSILYGFLSFSNIISPLIVIKLGEKWALILSTLTYILYIAANIKVTSVTLCLAAAILGVGGAVLWTAQGSWVIRCSTVDTLGFHTGLFFALFQMDQLIGNLGAGVLITSGLSDTTLFLILTIVASSSILGFLMLGNPKKQMESGKEEEDKLMPTSKRLMLTIDILKERPIQLLVPALLYSGISQSFFFGVFPPLSGKDHLAYIMTVFGTCDVIGSVVFGKLSDMFGRKIIIVLSTFLCMGGSIFVYIIYDIVAEDKKLALYFVCAGLMGFSDAGYNTQLYALVGSLYPTRGEPAVAVFKFVQSIATAIAFFYGHYVILYQHVIILNSFVIPACILFIIVDYKFKPPPKNSIEEESYQNKI